MNVEKKDLDTFARFSRTGVEIQDWRLQYHGMPGQYEAPGKSGDP